MPLNEFLKRGLIGFLCLILSPILIPGAIVYWIIESFLEDI